ncbi:DNA polymerase III subunit alpha [Desulfurella sp.]|uniref:DNA polymerase III subunit alpha n=1 Tax=Desulfurella sp. TaxID=1962857 RepID=UPI003D0EA440
MSFVHLHNHSEYSLLDGANKINAMVEKAKSDNQEYVALTDHGNMFGVLDFYKTCTKNNVKPIIGFEAYLAPDRFDKSNKSNFHLTLLAKNNEGYQNLLKLSTFSYTEGFYYKPRIDKQLLREYSEGIIAGSACLHGEINYYLLNNDYNLAKKACLEYQEIFGKDNFFIEIMRHDLPEQTQIEPLLLRLANEINAPVVATNDCHYLNKTDAKAQDALLCIQTNRLINEEDRMKMRTQEFYFKTQEEMYEKFKDLKEAPDNSYLIAKNCSIELELGKLIYPVFSENMQKDNEMLENLAKERLEKRIKNFGLKNQIDVYYARLEYELNVIKQMNFSGYFLIVWDFINYAKSRSIPVGPGRGSAAGSLVSYSLGITDIDPIKYGLLFERFLNPERISMPDVDVDFCVERRDEVISYVQEKYGQYNVAQVATFGTMLSKAVIRDVARVMGFSYASADKIAKLIPTNATLDEAINQVDQIKKLIKEDKQIEELFSLSKTLEGLKRHASKHAAGVVISQEPIYNRCPLYKPAGEDAIIAQFSKEHLEDVGLIKFDFLGLRNLTVIDFAVKLIKKYENENFDLLNIPTDNKEVFKLLQSGATLGVFQLESSGMQKLISELKPTVFEDLIALVALYRPGPLGSGMVKDFIERKHGVSKVEYPLPQLEPILKETYGIILYQEQVMQIANVLAGYTLAEADILRKSMGKKDKEKMAQQRSVFVERCIKNGIDEKKAESIFDLMEYFAGYGFNKSHSAAYAYIAYQTAYLKTHYPAYFMCALLASEASNTDKVAIYIDECNRLNIPILPPDINESYTNFTVVSQKDSNKKAIRFGLSAIKNVGAAAIEIIIEERKNGSFKDLSDFLKRADQRKVNKKVVESLIKSGCFDFVDKNRNQLLLQAENPKKSSTDLFGMDNTVSLQPQITTTQEEITKYEKELLGVFISHNPLKKYESIIKSLDINYISQLDTLNDESEIKLIGVVSSLKEIHTKNKQTMAFVNFSDLHGSIEIVVFPNLYEQLKQLNSIEPILIIGKLEKNEEKTSITAKQIIPMQEILKQISKITIVIDSNIAHAESVLKDIKQLTNANSGNAQLFICLQKPQSKQTLFKTKSSLKCDFELLEYLKKYDIGIKLELAS